MRVCAKVDRQAASVQYTSSVSYFPTNIAICFRKEMISPSFQRRSSVIACEDQESMRNVLQKYFKPDEAYQFDKIWSCISYASIFKYYSRMRGRQIQRLQLGDCIFFRAIKFVIIIQYNWYSISFN